MQKQPITQTGLLSFQKEREELLVTRKEAIADLAKARDMGDLSENGYYKAAKWKLGDVNRRLRFLDNLLRTVVVVETATGIVGVGTKVTIADDNEKVVYEIVSEHEADSLQRKISDKSPLGRALLGKKMGDNVVFSTPTGHKHYEILTIA